MPIVISVPDTQDRSNLKLNADGSLDIYLQSENPGADKEVEPAPDTTQAVLSPRAAVLAT